MVPTKSPYSIGSADRCEPLMAPVQALSVYPAPSSEHGFGVFWTISDLGRMATKNEEIYCVRSPRSVIVLI